MVHRAKTGEGSAKPAGGDDDKRELKPPAAVAAAARKGLALRKKFGRGGTHVGVARAGQLSAREALTPQDVRTISAYFARHAVDKNSKAKVWGDESDPSAGYIAWLLWGGDEGREWVDRVKREMADA